MRRWRSRENAVGLSDENPEGYNLENEEDGAAKSTSKDSRMDDASLPTAPKPPVRKTKKSFFPRIVSSPMPNRAHPPSAGAEDTEQAAPPDKNADAVQPQVQVKKDSGGKWQIGSLLRYTGRRRSTVTSTSTGQSDDEEDDGTGSAELESKLRQYAASHRIPWSRVGIVACSRMMQYNEPLEAKLRDLCNFIDLNDNSGDRKQCSQVPEEKPFDLFEMEALALQLLNPFSTVNFVTNNGLLIAFICPSVNGCCKMGCQDMLVTIKTCLGNWRCKCFTEFVESPKRGAMKSIKRNPHFNDVPFQYEFWWYPQFASRFLAQTESSAQDDPKPEPSEILLRYACDTQMSFTTQSTTAMTTTTSEFEQFEDSEEEFYST